MSELTVIARAVARAGRGDELERELRACVAPPREEAGNLHFELHRSLERPEEVIAIERTQPIMAAPPEVHVCEPLS